MRFSNGSTPVHGPSVRLLPGAAEAPETFAIAELDALLAVDLSLPPEAIDFRPSEMGILAHHKAALAGELRLPPPPHKPADASALFRAVRSVVGAFEKDRAPVLARPEEVLKEARMIALLRGIDGVESEIRGRAQERRRF